MKRNVKYFRCTSNADSFFDRPLTVGKVYKGVTEPWAKDTSYTILADNGAECFIDPVSYPFGWVRYFKVEPKRHNQYLCLKDNTFGFTKGKIYTNDTRDLIKNDYNQKTYINTYRFTLHKSIFKLLEPDY